MRSRIVPFAAPYCHTGPPVPIRYVTRPVDETGTPPAVGGWLSKASVAFLFQSGRIRWFQRTDQSKGLLSGLR